MPTTETPLRPMAAPAHPGGLLLRQFMMPLGLSAGEVAQHLGVSEQRIESIVAGTQAVDADMALRLSAAFGPPAELWLRLQMQHDLAQARSAERPPIQPEP